jgi:NADPH2:quinone reductase
MRAVWYDTAGPARDVLRVGEIATPSPGPNEVLVRIHASGVNPTDVKARAKGQGLDRLGWIIPHNDGAGVIEAVGPGIDAGRIGERVWTFGATASRTLGTCAEYTLLPAEQTVPIPEGTDYAAGACMGIPAMTAHFGVFGEGPVRSKTVLVHGGAGGVGYYAVQWAVWGRATVITTVSSPEKAERAAEAGADYVINYRTEDVAARVGEITAGRGVDRIVDVAFGVNLRTNIDCIAPGGSIASYGSDVVREPVVPFYELMYRNVRVHPFLVFRLSPEERRAAISDITTTLENGFLRHHIAQRMPLEETARAHEMLEDGELTGGKVVVEP